MAPEPTYTLEKSGNSSSGHVEKFDTSDEQLNDKNGTNLETMPLWRSCRLFVAVMGAAVMSTSIASQASMTSAMVCMIRDREGDRQHQQWPRNGSYPLYNNNNNNNNATINDTTFGGQNASDVSMEDSWQFSWDSQTQGWVVSSFFFGYFFMQMPSGIIVTRLGPKSCMTFGLIATGVLHLVSIPTARWSLSVLYAVRTLAGLTCGFMFPGIFALVANWCPRQETSIMFALPCLGFEFGNSFIFLVSLVGCELNFQGGWPVVFYTLGVLQIVVGVVMLVGVSDFPNTHRWVTQKEAAYINKYRVHEEKAHVIPYGKIFRSVPVWAFLMGQFAIEYAYYTIITQGPVYLRGILRLSHWKINTVSSVPFLIATPFAFIVGCVSDKLVAKNVVSTTCVRKSNETISKVLLASALSILALLPVGHFVAAFFIYLVAGIGIQFCYIGFMANPGDLSPAHAGFLAGLGQAATTWVSFVIPILTGRLASRKTREGWYIIFFIAVGLQVLCLIFFLLFGSGDLQTWATPDEEEKVPILDRNNRDSNNPHHTKKARYRTLSL